MHAFTYTPCEAVRRLHLAYFPAFHAPSRAPTPPRGAIDPKPLSLSLSLTFAITTVERQRFLAARDGDASLAAELLRKHLAWLGLGLGSGVRVRVRASIRVRVRVRVRVRALARLVVVRLRAVLTRPVRARDGARRRRAVAA